MSHQATSAILTPGLAESHLADPTTRRAKHDARQLLPVAAGARPHHSRGQHVGRERVAGREAVASPQKQRPSTPPSQTAPSGYFQQSGPTGSDGPPLPLRNGSASARRRLVRCRSPMAKRKERLRPGWDSYQRRGTTSRPLAQASRTADGSPPSSSANGRSSSLRRRLSCKVAPLVPITNLLQALSVNLV